MTRINSNAIRAVIRANFGLRGGLPILFMTAVWGGAVWALPGIYTVISIWYLASLGFVAGMGFRFKCAAPRSYLIPGLREYSRLIRFAFLLMVSCAVAAWSGNLETVPVLLAILWLWALAGFYAAGLSRHPVAVLAGAMFSSGATGVISRFHRYREISVLDPWWAVLFLLNVPLTIWIWRRIGTQRDLTLIRPGDGALSAWLETRSWKVAWNPPEIFRRSATSFRDRIRLFSFNGSSARATWWGFLSGVLFWSCIVSFRFNSADWSGPAFGSPLALPIIPGLLTLSASARMFMLPLRRSEIIRCLGAARFIRQLQSWAAIALPFAAGALLKGTAVSTVCLAFGATLAAQLPIFGLLLWAHSRKTASGIRHSIFLGPVLFIAAFVLSAWWTEPRTIAGALLFSLMLGPILIWLAYRRWLNTEVGMWASLPTQS